MTCISPRTTSPPTKWYNNNNNNNNNYNSNNNNNNNNNKYLAIGKIDKDGSYGANDVGLLLLLL